MNPREVYTSYVNMRVLRDNASSLWYETSDYVGIRLDVDHMEGTATERSSQRVDTRVDDPTAAIAVNQAGDALVGASWANTKQFTIVPSRRLKKVAPSKLNKYFSQITEETLYHMNHDELGYVRMLGENAYDWNAFGTGGIGIYPNRDYLLGRADNALVGRYYGPDNMVIDEGKSGQIEYVFSVHLWRVSRIVREFGKDRLPKELLKKFDTGRFSEEYKLVFGFYPQEEYDPRLQGKRGARYKGVWFFDNETLRDKNQFLFEEEFNERPINVSRMIKFRGEVWGRAPGTMLISTVSSVNNMFSRAIEVIEKMADPALGTYGGAIFGDSVVDTSPGGLTVFNPMFQRGQGTSHPVFPFYDVGDPTKVISYLVPRLNDLLKTAFKVDALLDFTSNREQTAREALLRTKIRNQSLSGVFTQQKTERLLPDIKRSISVLSEMGVFEEGDIPEPVEVRELRESGQLWYDVILNNDLERTLRAEASNSLLELLNAVGATAGINPEVVETIDWYTFIEEIAKNVDPEKNILVARDKYDEIIQEKRAAAAEAMAAESSQKAAKTVKDVATARKMERGG